MIGFKHTLTDRCIRLIDDDKNTLSGFCTDEDLFPEINLPIFFKAGFDEDSNLISNEFDVLSQLQDHDFIPKIISYSIKSDYSIIFLDLIEGKSLDTLECSDDRFIDILISCLDILQFLYENYGFIHGDLDISNIMVDKNDNVYLIDFEMSSISEENKWKSDLLCLFNGMDFDRLSDDVIYNIVEYIDNMDKSLFKDKNAQKNTIDYIKEILLNN